MYDPTYGCMAEYGQLPGSGYGSPMGYGMPTPGYGPKARALDKVLTDLIAQPYHSVVSTPRIIKQAPSNEIGALYRIAYAYGAASKNAPTAEWMSLGKTAVAMAALAKGMSAGRYHPVGYGIDLGKYATAAQISSAMNKAASNLRARGHAWQASQLSSAAHEVSIKAAMKAAGEEPGSRGKRWHDDKIPEWPEIPWYAIGAAVLGGAFLLSRR